MCGLCDFKPETYHNLVLDFGIEYGVDGNDTGKEEFARKHVPNTWRHTLHPAIIACEKHEN
jgi:hypothetical protein